jgi:predicted P-loop ATPase
MEKTKRNCPDCNQGFKPMSDKQWDHVKFEHNLMSIRHKKAGGNWNNQPDKV